MGERLAQVVPLARAAHAGPFPSPRYRLPAFCSSFVGRQEALDDLTGLLGEARLVSLVGAGGMGKTRLAVEVAERVAPGRAFFVDLAPVHGAALVGEEVAAAFGAGELRGRDLAEVLAVELPAGAFLVLDNCEHLIGACAELVERLLRGVRGLQVLATSQQRLRVAGEVVWAVSALDVPDRAAGVSSTVALKSAAVQLFCQRAGAVSRGFAASVANVAAIVEICGQLDGNPLAIELAAACTDVLSPPQIASRLEDRFGLLGTGGGGGGPARHQTLAAALAWSNELLSPPERLLLQRLSVFEGGFSLQAAEEVCACSKIKRGQILGLLSGLVAKSLVVADTSGDGARYRLLETVRHYAADGLSVVEAAAVGERHATWCLELTGQAADADDLAAWLAANQLGPESVQDNGRAALEWCLAHRRAELALRLAGGQMEFWQGSGRFAEARDWLERVVAAGEAAPPGLRASALHDAGFAAFMIGDFEVAHAHLRDSLALWAASGDAAGAERTQGLVGFLSTFGGGPVTVEQLEADLVEVRAAADDARLCEALVACAHARLFRGDAAPAAGHFEELVAVGRRNADDGMVAAGLVGAGAAKLSLGDHGSALAHLEDGVALAAAAGQAHTEAGGRTWLAELARLAGDDQARARFEACLVEARSLGAPYPLARSLLGLGRVVLGQGEAEAAQVLFDEAAAVAGQAGLGHAVAAALDGSGQVAVALGDATVAGARFDEALAAAEGCGDQAAAALVTYHLAELARAGDDLARAVSLHHQALKQRQAIDDRAGVADSLDGVAGVYVAGGNLAVAARLFGATHALRRAGGLPRLPGVGAAVAADVAELAERMTPEERNRAWAQGEGLAGPEAVAHAVKDRRLRIRTEKGPGSLTAAERDVVALLVVGLTNAEIADRLFVSPRTVQSHLRNVYAKLNVTSRQQLRRAASDVTA